MNNSSPWRIFLVANTRIVVLPFSLLYATFGAQEWLNSGNTGVISSTNPLPTSGDPDLLFATRVQIVCKIIVSKFCAANTSTPSCCSIFIGVITDSVKVNTSTWPRFARGRNRAISGWSSGDLSTPDCTQAARKRSIRRGRSGDALCRKPFAGEVSQAKDWPQRGL